MDSFRCRRRGNPPDPQKTKTAIAQGFQIMTTHKKYKLSDEKMRTNVTKVRFNESEYEKVLARQSGNTFAGWLRQVALDIVPIHQADAELVRNIGRIGSNLNQLARYVNTEKSLDQNVLNEIVAIRSMLKQLIDQNIADAVEDNSDDR